MAVTVNVAGIERNVYDEVSDLDENRNKRLRSEMPPKLFCVDTLPLTAQYSTPIAQMEREFPLTLY
jgi:hypothetical protein